MVLKFLPADVNQGYHQVANWIIKEVNGEKVNSMRELINLIETDNGSGFVELKSPSGSVLVLDRDEAAESHDEILSIYRIVADRSADLMP